MKRPLWLIPKAKANFTLPAAGLGLVSLPGE